MKISVIIPTLNAENYMTELILKLKTQSIRPTEIIIVDSSSEDNTTKIASALGCKVIPINRDEFDHGGSRNLGVEFSVGEILVFMTQDAIPVSNTLLEKLVAPLSGPNIAASFGRHLAMPNAIPPEEFSRLFNYPDTPMIKSKQDLSRLGIKTFFFSDVCSAIKRQVFKSIGRFPERIITSEDMVFASRLILQDYEIAYVPEATIWHSHNYSIFRYFKRYFDIGVSFNMNEVTLKYARAESEGLRFTKELFSFLIGSNYYRWIPHSIGLTLAKLVGYKLGLMEARLPLRLKRNISLNKGFWNSIRIS